MNKEMQLSNDEAILKAALAVLDKGYWTIQENAQRVRGVRDNLNLCLEAIEYYRGRDLHDY